MVAFHTYVCSEHVVRQFLHGQRDPHKEGENTPSAHRLLYEVLAV